MTLTEYDATNGAVERTRAYTGDTEDPASLVSETSYTTDEDGRVTDETSRVEGEKTATTSRSYNGPGDALSRVDEADGDVVESIYGTDAMTAPEVAEYALDDDMPLALGRGVGRLLMTKRDGLVVSQYRYDRDGRTDAVWSGPRDEGYLAAAYMYDGNGRVLKEIIHAAGVVRTNEYDDAGRLEITATSQMGVLGQPVARLEHLYDDAGRLLMVCDTRRGDCNDPAVEHPGYGIVSFRAYDTKGAFQGNYAIDGQVLDLTDDFQAGRLAYIEDQAGATFFEYDALGRVVAVVRHDGSLAAFKQSKLSVVRYAYGEQGQLVSIRYPSGRLVRYIYCADKERLCAVKVQMIPHDEESEVFVVSGVDYRPSGEPSRWRWGESVADFHTVDRDLLGQIQRIGDVLGFAAVSSMEWDYDEDGDVTEERSQLGSDAEKKLLFYRDESRDFLDGWSSPLTGQFHDLVYDAAGRRSGENIIINEGLAVFGAYAYNADHPERLSFRETNVEIEGVLEAVLTYDGIGQVSSIDWGTPSSPPEVNLAYGSLGNVVAAEMSTTGAFRFLYDHDMRRVKKVGPVYGSYLGVIDESDYVDPALIGYVDAALIDLEFTPFPGSYLATRFRYGLGAEVLEEREQLRVEDDDGDIHVIPSLIDEPIYLMGERIAVVHRSEEDGEAMLYYISTDRMGVPRTAFAGDGTIVAAVTMDAWGRGKLEPVPDADSGSPDPPSMQARYPGQYQDDETGLIENRYRTYIPELGMYTSMDAFPRSTEPGTFGPQYYAYAAARPLVLVDSDGRRFQSANEAARAAARAIRNLTQVWTNDIEFCSIIYMDTECAEGDARRPWNYTRPARYDDPIRAVDRCPWSPGLADARGSLYAGLHNHPARLDADILNGRDRATLTRASTTGPLHAYLIAPSPGLPFAELIFFRYVSGQGTTAIYDQIWRESILPLP
jgi:RHS repeat-associated protein